MYSQREDAGVVGGALVGASTVAFVHSKVGVFTQ